MQCIALIEMDPGMNEMARNQMRGTACPQKNNFLYKQWNSKFNDSTEAIEKDSLNS